MPKGKHPTVTVWKVSNTLKAAGISDEAAQEIITRLRGRTSRNVELRLKRTVQKNILQTLLRDGKCGLVLTRSNRVMVVAGNHITIPHWEKNLMPFVTRRKVKSYQSSRPHLSPEQREELRKDLRNGMDLSEAARKYAINYSTAHYHRQMLGMNANGADRHQPAAV